MINVDTLYSRVKDLARKDKAGYLGPDEFNRHLVDCQTLLFEFYASQLERDQDVPDAMRTFIERKNLPCIAGLTTIPLDFEHTLRVNWRKVTNVPGGEPVVSYIQALPLHGSEINVTLQNTVRGPNLTKKRVYYKVEATNLHIWPEETGSIEFEYLRAPITPNRATVLDSVNDEYNYNSAGSTQLEWEASQAPNFTDLLLWHYGLPTRETEIMQWVASKKGVVENR